MSKKGITVKFDEDAYVKILGYARQNNITQSYVITEAVKRFINEGNYVNKAALLQEAVSIAMEITYLMQIYPECDFRALQERGNSLCQLLSI